MCPDPEATKYTSLVINCEMQHCDKVPTLNHVLNKLFTGIDTGMKENLMPFHYFEPMTRK
jgi:hypothetical protein